MSAQKRQKSSSESKQDNTTSGLLSAQVQASSESTLTDFANCSEKDFQQICIEATKPRNKRANFEENNNLRNGEDLSTSSPPTENPNDTVENLIGRLRQDADAEIQKQEDFIDAKFCDTIFRHQSTSNSYHVPQFQSSQVGRPKSLPPGSSHSDSAKMTSSSVNSRCSVQSQPTQLTNYGAIQYPPPTVGYQPGGVHGTYHPGSYHQRQLSASAIMTSSGGTVPVDQSVNLPLTPDTDIYLTKNEDVPHLVNQLVRESKIDPNGSSPYLRSSSRTSDPKSVVIEMEAGSGGSSTVPEIPYIDDTGTTNSGWLPSIAGTAALTGIGDPAPLPARQDRKASLEAGDIGQQDPAIVWSGSRMPYTPNISYYSRGNEEVEMRPLLSHENSPGPRMNGMDHSRGGLSPEDTSSETGTSCSTDKKNKRKARRGNYDLTNQQMFGDAGYRREQFGFGLPTGEGVKFQGGRFSPPVEPTYRNLGSVPASGDRVRKKKTSKQGGVRNVIQAEDIEGHKGSLSIEEAMEFVEGRKLGAEERKQKKTPKKNSNGGKKDSSSTPPEHKSSGEEEKEEEPKKMTEVKAEERKKDGPEKLDLTDPGLYASDSFVEKIQQNPDLLLENLPPRPASANGGRRETETEPEFVPVVGKKHKKKTLTGRSSLGPTPRSVTPPLSHTACPKPVRARRRSNEMLPVAGLAVAHSPSVSRAPEQTTPKAPNLADLDNFPGIQDSVAHNASVGVAKNSADHSSSASTDASRNNFSSVSNGKPPTEGVGATPRTKTYASALLPMEPRMTEASPTVGGGGSPEEEVPEGTPSPPNPDGGWMTTEYEEETVVAEESNFPVEESVMEESQVVETEGTEDAETELEEVPEILEKEEEVEKKMRGGGTVRFEDRQFFEEEGAEKGLFEFGDFSDVDGGNSASEEERREVTEKHKKLIQHFCNNWWTNSKSRRWSK